MIKKLLICVVILFGLQSSLGLVMAQNMTYSCATFNQRNLGMAKDLFETSVGIGNQDCIQGTTTNQKVDLPYKEFYQTYLDQAKNGSFEAPLYSLIKRGLDLVIWILSALAGIYMLLAGFRVVAGGLAEDALKNQTMIMRNIVVGIVVMNMANFFVGTVFFQYDASSEAAKQTQSTIRSYKELNERLAAAEGSTPLQKFDPELVYDPKTKQMIPDPNKVKSDWNAKTAPLLVSQTVVFPLMQFFLGFLAGVIVLYIIIAAFKIIAARGDSDDVVKNAKRQMLNAMIGLALVFASRAMVNTIYGTPFVSDERLNKMLDPNATAASAQKALQPQVVEGMGTLMNIMNYLLGFFAIIGVVMFIYGGLLIVTAGVKEDNRKKGISIMKWTTVSMFLAMGAYAFVSTILRLSI